MAPFLASQRDLIMYSFKWQFPCDSHLREVLTNAMIKTNIVEQSHHIQDTSPSQDCLITRFAGV